MFAIWQRGVNSIGTIVPELALSKEPPLLPVGVNFTRRFWATDDIKRRLDYHVTVTVSGKETKVKIEVFSYLFFIHFQSHASHRQTGFTTSGVRLFMMNSTKCSPISTNCARSKVCTPSLPNRHGSSHSTYSRYNLNC